MPYRVTDIVVHTPDPDDRMMGTRPVDHEVAIGHEVSIERLDRDLARDIIALCSPNRLKHPPVIQLVPRYAFVRRTELADSANPYQFDHDGRLNGALAVSRLIQPTAVGFEHSARIIHEDDGTVREMTAGAIKGMSAFAYVAGVDARNWLTNGEALTVGQLFDAFVRGETTFPERVVRALWRHEYAARSEYLDVRWLFVVSALEALLKIKHPPPVKGQPREAGSTRQFKARTVGLASRYVARGLMWTASDAGDAYEQRSDVAHGLSLNHASPPLDLYVRMEALLRYALAELLTSPAFATTFQTDAAIEACWPA